MDKRKLSKLLRIQATGEMCETAKRLSGINHIVTACMADDIVLMNFYSVSDLKKGKVDAQFRTFLSKDDYITQDLSYSKTKWLTAGFINMWNFEAYEYVWDNNLRKSHYEAKVYINSREDLKILEDFFKDYRKPDDKYIPWSAIYRFQEWVRENRLDKKHKKVTDLIDQRMKPVKEVPKQFVDWVWEEGMSFSRYVIYKEIEKNKAECECEPSPSA